MPNFRRENPMSTWREEDRRKRVVDEDSESIYYEDGSSIRKGGGPCGPMSYDEYGEEC